MCNHTKSKIFTYLRMIIMECVFVLLFNGIYNIAFAADPDCYTNHVIFTAPSAEKIFDGRPLTEQIDVTVQGLPAGFTYKAVAEGSVTYPEDNAEDNNIVTDYIIYDPSGLNVTNKFVNVETRPGTLRVSYAEADVLGARRDEHGNEVQLEDETAEKNTEKAEEPETIEDEDAPLAGTIEDESEDSFFMGMTFEAFIYSILFSMMIVVLTVYVLDSNRLREK